MAEFLLVSALLPSFILCLVAMNKLQPTWQHRRNSTAPILYAVCVVVAVLLACILAEFDAQRLGLVEPNLYGSRLLAYAVTLPVAASVALGMFFFELGVASSVLNRGRNSNSTALQGQSTHAGTEPFAQSSKGRSAETGLGHANALAGVVQLVSNPVIFGTIALVTALGEELLFRGLLLSTLRSLVPLSSALIVQAIMFGTNHASFGVRNVLTKSINGIGWGFLTIAFGSIVVSALSHILFQYLVFRRLARQLDVR